MKFSKIITLLWCCLSLIPPLHAQETQEKALTLQDCTRITLQSNPQILSSLQQYQASLARTHQARAFAQPSLHWNSDLQNKLFGFSQAGEWYFGISQHFEFPTRQILKGQIANKESKELLQEIEGLKVEMEYLVKKAFYSVLLSQENLKYSRQNLDLSKDFLNSARFKFEAGDADKVEVLRAQLEVAKAENAVRRIHNDVLLAKANLNYLMARRKYDPLEVQGELKAGPLALDLAAFKEQALSFRPEMKKIRISLERQNLQKSYATQTYLPDFELGISRHHLEEEGRFWNFTLSFNIPLFFWQPVRGEIAEAGATLKALSRDLEHLENTISLEVEGAYLNAVRATDQIHMFEDNILKQAEEIYEMFSYSYKEGDIGSLELIDARRTLLESQTSYLDAQYSFRLAIAALEKSIGRPLDGYDLK